MHSCEYLTNWLINIVCLMQTICNTIKLEIFSKTNRDRPQLLPTLMVFFSERIDRRVENRKHSSRYAEIINCSHCSRVLYFVTYLILQQLLVSPAVPFPSTCGDWSIGNIYHFFFFFLAHQITWTVYKWKNSSASIVSVGSFWSIHVICCKHQTCL